MAAPVYAFDGCPGLLLFTLLMAVPVYASRDLMGVPELPPGIAPPELPVPELPVFWNHVVIFRPPGALRPEAERARLPLAPRRGRWRDRQHCENLTRGARPSLRQNEAGASECGSPCHRILAPRCESSACWIRASRIPPTPNGDATDRTIDRSALRLFSSNCTISAWSTRPPA